MAKTLIYLNKNALNPAGGPNGVGYYIYEEIHKRNLSDSFTFLDFPVVKKKPVKAPRFVKFLGRVVANFKKYYVLLFKKPKDNSIDFNEFDIIHFHSTQSMFEARNKLSNYKGIVLLTSHSPVPLHQEILTETISSFEKVIFHWLYKRMKRIDEYAFVRADYITFPCEESEESYFKNWNEYSFIRKKDKMLYIPTGISERTPTLSKDDYLQKYKIDSSAFNICFVGRHSKIKGYDRLKVIFRDFVSKHPNTNAIIAGKEKPLRGLKHKNWKEIGFTKDPYSIIKYSDVFVLPNKETYFDLVVLEALSLGSIVLTTRTGGNKLFEKMNAKGVFLFDDNEEAVKQLERIFSLSQEEKDFIKNDNLRLFNSYFSNSIFFDNYQCLINKLLAIK